MLIGIVHRDIKPQNMIYDEQANKLLFIDLGLAQQIRNPDGSLYIISSDHFKGTIAFAPRASHEYVGYQFKDDVEAFCYVFIYIMQSRLPW